MTQHRALSVDLPRSGELVLFDTEFTAWEGSQARYWSEEWEHRELVEIGAVRVDAANFDVLGRFRCLTVPFVNPILSDYFSSLTGIDQKELEKDGLTLPALLSELADFGRGAAFFVSNGDDKSVLYGSAELQGISIPIEEDRFINVRATLAQIFEKHPDQLTTGLMPEWLGLPPKGAVHSAVDDAVALARALGELRRVGRI